MCWAIWKAGNAFIFEHIDSPSKKVAWLAKRWFEEFKRALALPSSVIINVPALHQFLFAGSGKFHIYCDAAFSGSLKVVAVKCMLSSP